jgi:peptide-methionine (S)-S-oxide reductase
MMERAIMGGGCFWCTEAVFLGVKGVSKVESAYAGGAVVNPTYAQICDGDTGHAEVVSVEFDPAIISYEQILSIFFGTHDPTTLNAQGHDVGTQYRSVIFTNNHEQQIVAKALVAKLTDDEVFSGPIVTQIEPLPNYYPAEAYHQKYYQNHPHQGYCLAVVAPKLSKFRKQFTAFMK